MSPAVIGLTVLSSILWVSLKSPSICFSSFKMTGCGETRMSRKAVKPPFCRRLPSFCCPYLLVVAPSVAEVCTVLPLVVVNLPQTSSVTLVERRFDFWISYFLERSTSRRLMLTSSMVVFILNRHISPVSHLAAVCGLHFKGKFPHFSKFLC